MLPYRLQQKLLCSNFYSFPLLDIPSNRSRPHRLLPHPTAIYPSQHRLPLPTAAYISPLHSSYPSHFTHPHYYSAPLGDGLYAAAGEVIPAKAMPQERHKNADDNRRGRLWLLSKRVLQKGRPPRRPSPVRQRRGPATTKRKISNTEKCDFRGSATNKAPRRSSRRS